MAIGASLLAASGAEAQTSFFDMIFGGSAPPQPQYRTTPRSIESVRPRTLTSEDDDSQGTAVRTGGATYRTICVRACDGFFFPISFATTRNNFAADQKKCQASCNEARLFVYRNPGEGVEDAIDLSGRPYTRIPNAFKFRKVHVEQCGCRPPPWTEAELQRHQSYAAVEEKTPAGEAARGEVKVTDGTTAGTDKPSAGNPLAVAASDDPVDGSEPVPVMSEPPATKAAVTKPRPRQASKGRPPARSGVTSVATAGAQGGKAGSPSGSGFSFFSMGLGAQPQYVWPGDPPRRR